jgi:hypothetical protein
MFEAADEGQMAKTANTPSAISEPILSLCRSICASQQPVYVKHSPELYAQVNDCFPAVDRKIRECGGEGHYGWQLWEWPDVLLEAEFHAVWLSPENELVDITPKPFKPDRILFLPDPNMRYKGEQVNNIRVPLSRNPATRDFIGVCDAIFRIQNRGDRANQLAVTLEGSEAQLHQCLQETKLLLLQMLESGLTRSSQCPCNSGKKYKACHGRKLDKKLARA